MESTKSQPSYSQILERVNRRENLKLLYTLVFSAIALAAVVIIPSYLLNNRQDLRQSAALNGNGVLLGVSPRSGNTLITDTIQFEADSGKQVAIINFWEQVDPAYPWGTYQTNMLNSVKNHHGAIPMISWEPAPWGKNNITSGSSYSLANFLRGDFDTLIRSYARGIKTYNNPVLIRWAHEMNGDWYSWGVGRKADGSTPNNNTPQQYVDVWKKVRSIFQQEGTTNAQFVWCPNVNDNGNRPIPATFPGEDQVDWICLDGYNWNNPWLTFDQVYKTSYDTITTLSQKPLMIGEFASNEAGDDGTKKAAWITNAYYIAIPSYPRLKAVLWFNVFFDNANWPITSTVKAKTAFAQAVADPYYLSSWDGQIGSLSPTTMPTQAVTPTSIATTSAPTVIPTSGTSPTPILDRTSPLVTITSPIPGATVRTRKNTNITASASDNVKVSQLEFYINGSLICTDIASPYTCSWKVPTPRNVSYSISVKAYDTAGNSSIASINVIAR